MRILIGTHHLERLGGTEMWTRVMYDALSTEPPAARVRQDREHHPPE